MASVVCPNCGSVGYPKNKVPGSFVVELLLWIAALGIAFAGFWPAIIGSIAYSLWRLAARQKVCRECGEKGLVPITSPRGKELIERYGRPPEQSSPHPLNEAHKQAHFQKEVRAERLQVQREGRDEKLQITRKLASVRAVASARKGALSNAEWLIVAATVAVIAYIVVLYFGTKKPPENSSNVAADSSPSSLSGRESVAQSNAAAPSYKVLEQWSIPNGGFGRTIVVEANPTEEQLRALGEKLRQETNNERNAFVFVYDDERAARNGRAAFSERLPETDLQHHDRHQVAKYLRNANTGFHELDITPKGLGGPNSKMKYQ